MQQVASELQVHPETIRRAIKRGELKAYTIGKSYRVADEDIDEFMKIND